VYVKHPVYTQTSTMTTHKSQTITTALTSYTFKVKVCESLKHFLRSS